MSELRERIKEFNDNILIEQYLVHRDEYSPEAIACMEEEIALRDLSKEAGLAGAEQTDDPEGEKTARLLREDFIPLTHSFTAADMPLAAEMLYHAKIPFAPVDLDAPDGGQHQHHHGYHPAHTFSFRIPESLIGKAEEALKKLFQVTPDGMYAILYGSFAERLKSFRFNEVMYSHEELQDEVAVQFTGDETAALLPLTEKLLSEADSIEQETGRVLFYYDNLEECRDRLAQTDKSPFTHADLLSILEVMQIYCDKHDFPQVLQHTAEALLDFYMRKDPEKRE